MNKPIEPGGLPSRREPKGEIAQQPAAQHRASPVAPSWAEAEPYSALLLAARRQRRQRLLLRLAILVGMPTLATALFFLLVASPRYVSRAELTYEIFRPPQSLAAGLAQSFSGTSQNNTVDLGSIIYEYVRSDAIVRRVGRTVPLQAAFARRSLDWFSRLRPHASAAEVADAFRARVSVSEGLGGFIAIEVATADPELSLSLARAVVSACDTMVDDMTMRARQDEMAFAEGEVGREEDRVRNARLALTAFQDAHGNQDPARMASQLGTIVGALETDLAAARTQLAETVPFVASGSPALRQIRARIASLGRQLDEQKARLAGPSGTPFSQILADYARLQLDEEFARSAYTQAEQGLAVARADAARKQNYLVAFVEPVLPDRRDLRTPLATTASVFCAALLASVALSVLAGALRDQADP